MTSKTYFVYRKAITYFHFPNWKSIYQILFSLNPLLNVWHTKEVLKVIRIELSQWRFAKSILNWKPYLTHWWLTLIWRNKCIPPAWLPWIPALEEMNYARISACLQKGIFVLVTVIKLVNFIIVAIDFLWMIVTAWTIYTSDVHFKAVWTVYVISALNVHSWLCLGF